MTSSRPTILCLACLVAGVVATGPLSSSPVSAEEPLHLARLLKAIRDRNPTIAGASDRRVAAQIRIGRARALDDPFATVMVEDVPTTFRGGMPMVRFQATQMLPWPGKRDRMAAVAERETDAAAAHVDTTVLDAMTQGRRLYHQLYLNSEARRINRNQRAIVDALVDIANGRLSSGVGSHHDVLKMQTEASMLDDNLIMLRADRVEMAAMVNALLDLPASAPVGEPSAIWSPPLNVDRDKLVNAALERRPELREMAAMGAAEHAMADVARREYYPDVMVGGLYDLRAMGGADTLGAMIGINLPIWVGMKQRLDVEAAETRALAVGRERGAMAAMVRVEIERGLIRIDAAERRIRLLDEEFIPRAQQTFDSALRAFPAGMMSVLEVLDSLRVVTNQRLQRVAVGVDRELAIVDLARATGVPVGEIR
jgi:cobalt-zinc-cadmium efflux system outer membrane protein